MAIVPSLEEIADNVPLVLGFLYSLRERELGGRNRNGSDTVTTRQDRRLERQDAFGSSRITSHRPAIQGHWSRRSGPFVRCVELRCSVTSGR